MPAVVMLAAGAWAGGAVAAGLGLTGTFAGYLVSAVVSFAVSSVGSSVMGLNESSDTPSDSMQGIERGMLLNTAGTTDPIPVVYGRRRLGGTRVFAETTGDNNAQLHIVIAHCEGPVEAIETIYLDGVASDDEKFSGFVTTHKHLGADDQSASAELMSAFPEKWTANHRLRGVAYTHIILTYDQDVFTHLPTITADIKGLAVFDPRDSSTAWSSNPALCLRDYLTNARYGRGIPQDQIDDVSFAAAANACDVTHTTPAGTRVRHTCNGVVNTDDSAAANVQKMLSTVRGRLVFSASGYGLVVDKAETPTAFEFNEDNIVGAWKISLGGKRVLTNRVRANWYDPENEWQQNIHVSDSATYRTADSGLLLERQIELPFSTDPYEVQTLAERQLRQSRFAVSVNFRATIAATFCEVGDVVPITHSTPGWSHKPFRIEAIRLMSSDEVEIEATEYDDAVYSTVPLTAPRVFTVTNLPDPTSCVAPANLSLDWGDASGAQLADGTFVPSMAVTWTAADAYASEYEIQWKTATGDWVSAKSLATGYTISPLIIGEDYTVRVRAINARGVRSAWTTETAADYGQFAGQPANVTATAIPGSAVLTQISWDAVPGADYYVIDQAGAANVWQRTGETKATTWADSSLFGAATHFRIAAVRGTQGPWSASAWLDISYLGFWTGDSNLLWSASPSTLMWSS